MDFLLICKSLVVLTNEYNLLTLCKFICYNQMLTWLLGCPVPLALWLNHSLFLGIS